MNKQYVILLSACVDPKGMSYTYLTDKDVRKQQYKEALNFYLRKTSLPVVFCENTLCVFSGYFNEYIETGRLEYLTFDGNNFDKSKGKGYGEMEIMEYAFDKSRLLKNSCVVVKITGRLKILNINALLRMNKLLMQPMIQANYINGGGKMMDSRIVFAPKDFWKNELIKRKEFLDDSAGVYFEHILFLSVCEQRSYLFLPFVIVPDVVGKSGSTGVDYARKISCRETLSYAYYSLGKGVQLSAENMRMKYSYILVCFIQVMRFAIKLLYCSLSFRWRRAG